MDKSDSAQGKKHRLATEPNGEQSEPSGVKGLPDGTSDEILSKKPRTEEPAADNDSEEDEVSEDEDDDDDEDTGSSDMDIGEGEEEEEDLDEEMADMIVDFEGVPPVEEDVEAIESLVGQVFRGLPINTRKISQLVVVNEHLSTLLKDEGADDPSTYAVSSVINLSHPATGLNSEIAVQFRDLVSHGIEELDEDESNKDILSILDQFASTPDTPSNRTFGLLVIEKVVNIPTAVIWKLLSTLIEDLGYEDLQYTHFFVMIKMYRVAEEVYPVEEYYEPLQTLSSLQCDFSLPKDVDTIPHNGKQGIPFRRLLVIGAPEVYQTVHANAL